MISMCKLGVKHSLKRQQAQARIPIQTAVLHDKWNFEEHIDCNLHSALQKCDSWIYNSGLNRLPSRRVHVRSNGQQLENLRLHRRQRLSELLDEVLALVQCMLAL